MSRSRFSQSQSAHKRLFKKARDAARGNGKNSYIAAIKAEYHARCHTRQDKLDRVLSRSEKKRVFSDVIQMAKYNV